MDLGPHAFYIWTSYGVVFALLVVIIFWLIYDGHRLARIYKDLEERGVTRRSSKASSPKDRG